jgi:hypothetical protein
MIPFIEEHKNLPLNVSRSSRAALSNTGVAKPTYNKLSNWAKQLSIPFEKLISRSLLVRTFKATDVNSNAGQWWSILHGFQLAAHDTELAALISFLEARSDTDYLMVKAVKKQIKQGKINKDDNNAIWLAQLPTWEKHSLVPEEQLSIYTEFMTSADNPKHRQDDNAIALLTAVYHLIFDFYLAAIAHYEIGFVLYEQRHYENVEIDKYLGIFSAVMDIYLHEDNDYSCFSAMLEALKQRLAKNGNVLGWREIAAFIPLEDSGQSPELFNDRQYKQLKDWRKGENMPSNEKMRLFIEAMIQSLGDYSPEPILDYFRIARAIDNLVAKQPDKRVIPIVKKVLAEYPRYFSHYKQQLTN